MKLYSKILISAGLCAVSLTALYYGALFSLPKFVDLNKYKENVFSAIESETGYKVTSEDIYFKRNLTPFLKIHLYHTAVRYPDNSLFMQLKETDLQIKLLPLLFKRIVIKDAQITRPIINITLYKDFSTSLEKFANNNKIIDTKGFKLYSIANESLFKNYKIKFKDETINKTFFLEGEELLLKDIQLNDKAHILVKGSIFEGKKEYIKYDIDLISALNREHQFTFSPFKTILDSDVKGSIKGVIKADKDNNINGSLKIEDLSLKLNDIISKSNNADIVFNGQEADIDAVFHTSQKDIAKIKGKYSFGKKKYIDFDTKAKNIDLENLFKIISSVSKILNIQNPLNDVKLTGLLDADFNINSDFKKLKSKGKAKITGATISHKDLPYPVKDINADINFNNNNINVERAVANINNTPINLEGSVKEDLSANIKAYSDNLDLKALKTAFLSKKDMPFEILNGKVNFVSQITGKLSKTAEVVSDIHISDLNLVENKTKTPITAKTVNINIFSNDNKYKGDISAEKLVSKIEKNQITAEKFSVSFDDKLLKIPQNEFLFKHSPVHISGEIKDYSNNPYINIDFKSDVDANDIGILLKQYVKSPYKAVGKINTAGKITGVKTKQTVKAVLKADKDNYISYMVIKELLNKPSAMNLDFDFANNSVNIKDLTLYLAENSNKIFTVTGEVNKNSEFKNLKISVPNTISAKTNFFGGEDFSFRANMLLNGNQQKPLIKGNVLIDKYNIKKYLTAIKHADISFNDDNIRILAPDVQVNDSVFNITADVLPVFNTKNITVNNVQVNSINLDMNNLFPMLYSNRSVFDTSSLNIRQGSITVNNFKMLDLKASDISSDFKIDNNIFKLSNIKANAYYGIVSGKSDYNLRSGLLNIDMKGSGLDVKNSLYDLCKYEDNLSGKADVSAKVSLMTGNYDTVLKTLNGSVQFNAQNGGMGTLGKFEYYLSAKNIMYHGLLNATINRISEALNHDKTEQYRIAKGNVLFQNGYIISNDIQTVGNKMSLYIMGRHNMLTNQSNLDIYGRVSDDITRRKGTAGDVSLAELFSGQSARKEILYTNVSTLITDKIPDLAKPDTPTNTFKVNILGDIKAVNSINSFEWIAPLETEEKTENEFVEVTNTEENKPQAEEQVEYKPQQEKSEQEEQVLPDFSDIIPEI